MTQESSGSKESQTIRPTSIKPTSIKPTATKSNGAYFRQGMVIAVPFVLVVVPFGLLFGAVATEAGLSLIQTMAMTIIVIAGASQFAAIQLLVENAPVFIAVLTGLAVNMRMAMYSASLAPHIGNTAGWKRALAAYFLIDQSYAASILKFERSPEMQPNQKLAYFFGTMAVIGPVWYAATYAGVFVGAAIPSQYALDFAVPITFIALVAPSLRSLPHVAAAFVSVSVSLALSWMPYNAWLIIAALLAMMTGAAVEQYLDRRNLAKQKLNRPRTPTPKVQNADGVQHD